MKKSIPETHAANLPTGAIERIVEPIVRFMHIQASSGVVLLLATIAALVVANSPWSAAYLGFWRTEVGVSWGGYEFIYPLKHWINDGVMTIFFFVIGLEVKRELVTGELRDPKRAVLPLAAAIGGMVVPAGLYYALQVGEPGERGWGIPMATDIAFVIGCVALLGQRIPKAFRVFLLSLAIADDIGAILVIAIGYSESISGTWLVVAALGVILTSFANRLGIRSFVIYILLGVFVWFAFHECGIHATIAGVILGLMTPARGYVPPRALSRVIARVDRVLHGDWDSDTHRARTVQELRWATREVISPLEYLEHRLHPWVGFVIMPVFALANAGVVIELAGLTSPVASAVFAGLVIGKPVGIVLFSWMVVVTGLARLPEGVTWPMVLGGGFLSGIGFTMALFIANLAFGLGSAELDPAKLGILVASVVAAAIGMGILLTMTPRRPQNPEPF